MMAGLLPEGAFPLMRFSDSKSYENTTEASTLSECSSDESLLSSLNFSPEEMEIVRGFQKNFPGIDLESYLRSKVIDLCTGLDKQYKYIAERSECENDKKEDAGE